MIKNYGPFMKVVVYLSLALALVTVASCAKKAPSGSSATEDSNSLSTVAPSEEPEGVILTEPGRNRSHSWHGSSNACIRRI